MHLNIVGATTNMTIEEYSIKNERDILVMDLNYLQEQKLHVANDFNDTQS